MKKNEKTNEPKLPSLHYSLVIHRGAEVISYQYVDYSIAKNAFLNSVDNTISEEIYNPTTIIQLLKVVEEENAQKITNLFEFKFDGSEFK